MTKLPEYLIEQRGKWFVVMCEGHEVPPFTQFASAEDAEEAVKRYRREDEDARDESDLDDLETFYAEQNKL